MAPCAVLLRVVVFLFNLHLALYHHYEYVKHLFESDDVVEYDFVIVGCGTAGSVVAHHLSEDDRFKFAILEAGGIGSPMMNAPALAPVLHGSIHDWQYKTAPQDDSCLAMEGRRCAWPSGKIVGGSAKINNMIHVNNYVDEILPWFNGKYTKENLIRRLVALEYFDLPKEKLRFTTDLAPAVLKAAAELGYDIDADSNYDTKMGFSNVFVNQRDGSRWSTSHTLLSHNFSNGELFTRANVEKLIFDKNLAKGVLFERYGRKHKIFAKRGIILTAGAVGSAKLLLLSGIGPKNHLSNIGIPLKKNLPVGRNLMDHVSTGLDLILLNESLNLNTEDLIDPINAWNYYLHGKGPWTTPGCEIVAFLDSSGVVKKFNRTVPDLQFMVLPLGLATDFGSVLYKSIGVTEYVYDNYFGKISANNSISILPIVLHPKSSGFVELINKNPEEPPKIDPKYFSNKIDVDVLIKGVEIIKKLIKTDAMRALGAKLNPNLFPGCEKFIFDTVPYWECYVRHLTLTTFHPAGTCRMGDSSKSDTVVDYNFNIKGIENLFVADASVFPTLPSGNINTAVALIANLFVSNLLQNIVI